MIIKFYVADSGSNGAGDGHNGGKAGNNKFPEDPGTENSRIPDGGGPADGFIDEKGHSTGEGFLGHVEESQNANNSNSGDGGSESQG